jgi:DNA polymerase-3 subunit epsilon
MREIVLDTETTGLNPESGDRIVEIGCVELDDRKATGRVFHKYLNPDRKMSAEAFQVTGLSDTFLSDKERFADIADEFVAFLADSPLVIHNASFDIKFLNSELTRVGHRELEPARAVDTLDLARRRFPGSPLNLDALCRRFEINNASRDKHGALLDAELLAEVYVELTGGRQAALDFAVVETELSFDVEVSTTPFVRKLALSPRISEQELTAHIAFVKKLGDKAIWNKFAQS